MVELVPPMLQQRQPGRKPPWGQVCITLEQRVLNRRDAVK
jgi:hypothetical protein